MMPVLAAMYRSPLVPAENIKKDVENIVEEIDGRVEENYFS